MTVTPPLQPGDPHTCPRCRNAHVVEQPYRDRTTAERRHLYITCGGKQYYVGQVLDEDERSARDA